MATTLTLQNTTNFVKPILKNQPVSVSSQEPGLTVGNIVLQRMLAAPMRWRFNRNTFSFATTAPGGGGPVADYVEVIADLGFLEDCWLVDSSGNISALTKELSLMPTSDTGRPNLIALQNDDNAGNITIRLQNAPDAVYTVNAVYQKKAALIKSYGEPWGVVPDEFSFCYNLGFLTFISLLVNDSRFPIFEKWFVGSLLGLQDGLSEQEKNIFLGLWMADVSTVARAQGRVNQGIAGRGN